MLSLSQLQLQATSGAGSPHSPLQQPSPPLCFSPQPSSGNVSPLLRAVATPPPLSLDSIREEPSRSRSRLPQHSPLRQTASSGATPQISITSDTGAQTFIAASSSDSNGEDEMDTSPSPEPPSPLHASHFCLLRGNSLDSPLACRCEEEEEGGAPPPRPSIMRGTGVACLARPPNDNERSPRRRAPPAVDAATAANKHHAFVNAPELLRKSFPPLGGAPPEEADAPSSDSENNLSAPSSPRICRFPAPVENAPQRTGSGSLLFGMPNKWSRLPVREIVGAIVALVDSRAPSLVREDVRERGLSLRDPAAGAEVEVEVEVASGPAADSKALKMRRVSGDDSQYSQLCQQLINCMTT